MSKGVKIIIFVLLSLMTLWYVGKGGKAGWAYHSLSAQSPLEGIHVRACEGKKERYYIEALYVFFYQNNAYTHVQQIGSIYPNQWAMVRGLEKLQKALPSHVWFNPKKPTHCVLEKHFPIKDILSAVVVLAIDVYLIGLMLFLKKRSVSASQ